MSSVNTTGQTNQAANTTNTNNAGKSSKTDVLGKTDFLHLLTTQLKYQDPMNPMDDKSFIAQMAQFSALEESSKLNKTLTANQEFERFTSASVLIGRTVKIEQPAEKEGEDKVVVTGIAQEVKKTEDGVQIMVNDKLYNLDHVVEVKE